ncbi:MAG: hypothetical protein AB7P69_26215, partial [Candidatus Binatia bacterium]
TKGNVRVRFSFQGLRDYITVFHVLKWHEASIEKFTEDIRALRQDGMHQEILHFFYRQGYSDKNRTLDGSLRAVAEEYLNFFSSVLEDHFSDRYQLFSLYPVTEIGFVATVNLQAQRFLSYGFRNLQGTNSERILLLSVNSWEARRLPYLYGVQKLHGASLTFDRENFEVKSAVLNDEVAEDIKNVVKNGRLDESESRELAIEMVTSLVERQQYIFSRLRRSVKVDDIFPLVFEEIKKALLQRKLEDHFRDERVKYKKRQGLLTEQQNGDAILHVCYFYPVDNQWVESQVQHVLEGGPIPEQLPRSYDRMEERLDTCIKILGLGTLSISAPIFPDLRLLRRRDPKQISPSEMLDHCTRVYAQFLETYKVVVERNFPTFRQGFSLYSQMPVVYFISLGRPLPFGGPAIKIRICRDLQQSNPNRILSCSEEELQIGEESLEHRGETYDLVGSGFTSWDSFTDCREIFSDVEIERTAILRGLVYEQIQQELDGALDFLFEKYGVHNKR